MTVAFTQTLHPAGGVTGSTLLALLPVAVLLVALAVLRMTAWVAVIIGSIATIVLAIAVWNVPTGDTFRSYFYGTAIGAWAVAWIVFWGVTLYNTMVVTGAFDRLKDWLVQQATNDIRIQTILLAWAFGALLEGLVGFGYPWAVVAPILISLGVVELEAIRVGAIANNAPVSFGALGAPLIGLSKVTKLDIMDLSSAVGRIVALLALLPPAILIFLVSGWRGLKTGWPLAVAGSLGYIAGQYPIAEFVGPYLPDIVGSLTAFAAVFLLIRFWRPREILAFGGKPVVEPEQEAEIFASPREDAPYVAALGEPASHGGAVVGDRPPEPNPPDRGSSGRASNPGRHGDDRPRIPTREALYGLAPFLILIGVVIAWTGPWSKHYPPHSFWGGNAVTDYVQYQVGVTATSASGAAVDTTFKWNPFVAGSAVFVAWLLALLVLRPGLRQLPGIFKRTYQQIWGALIVAVFIFGLALLFNFSGMAASMADGFSKVGTPYIILAPILGWIGVALSGSNTAANTVFGFFQLQVGRLLHAPMLIFPALNSIGAEVGKPVAPQTASVGVSTTKYVRNEGDVIRHNMPWTLVILAYLIGIGALYYFLAPGAMR
jgi:lactate permease